MWRSVIPIAAMACAALTAAPASRADTKIVERTTIDCPGLKSMLSEIPSQQRAPLMKTVSPILTGAPWITTTYLTRNKMRTDMGATSIIVDAAHQRSTTINRKAHTYSIGPYDPFRKETGQMTAYIQAAPGSSSILGHKVRRYSLSLTSSIMPKSQISGEIWSAPDLAQPLVSAYHGGTAAILEREMDKVRGMPLEYRLIYKDTVLGDITVHSVATSIATAPLPQSAFTVPTGYKRGAATTPGMPSVGYPLGDGMPLDLDIPSDETMGMGSAGAGSLPEGLDQLLGGGGQGGLQGLTQALGGGGLSGLSQLLGSGQIPDIGQILGGSGVSGGNNTSGLDGAALGSTLKSLQDMLKSLNGGDGE